MQQIEEEINLIVSEGIDVLRRPDQSAQLYELHKWWMMQVVKNLFWNWNHIKEAFHDRPRLVKMTQELQQRHDLLKDAYYRRLEENGFQVFQRSTKTDSLLWELKGMEKEESELGDKIGAAGRQGLSVVYSWKELVRSLKAFQADGQNQAVQPVLDKFFKELSKIDRQQEGEIARERDPKEELEVKLRTQLKVVQLASVVIFLRIFWVLVATILG